MVEKIKALCKEKGTSMYKLEKELNLGNGTIGKWGKNGRVPNYANLSAVASALGVTVAELTGEADEKGIKNSPSTDHSAEAALDEELIRRLALLTPEEAARVDAFVQGILAAR